MQQFVINVCISAKGQAINYLSVSLFGLFTLKESASQLNTGPECQANVFIASCINIIK